MTSDAMSPRKCDQESGRQLSPEQAAAAAMVAEARARGLELTGPNGLLKLFTKNVLETALNEELTEHLGHAKHQDEAGRESTNVRNGSRSKTVISDAVGEVIIDVPRDREGTFEPQIVKKRQRRLGDVDEIVLSLYAKGLTTGEISAHFAEIYGASVSKDDLPDHRHGGRREAGLGARSTRSTPPSSSTRSTSRCGVWRTLRDLFVVGVNGRGGRGCGAGRIRRARASAVSAF